MYYLAWSDLLNDIIAELEGFVKQGGYEDEMKQALMEAYGGTDNAGEAMVEAATAAGLKDVRIEEEEWIAEYKNWEKMKQDADQPDPYGGI